MAERGQGPGQAKGRDRMAATSIGAASKSIPRGWPDPPRHRITGEDCYFVKVYLRSIDELEPILDLFTPHGRTTTSIVHSSPVPSRPLPVALRRLHVC